MDSNFLFTCNNRNLKIAKYVCRYLAKAKREMLERFELQLDKGNVLSDYHRVN